MWEHVTDDWPYVTKRLRVAGGYIYRTTHDSRSRECAISQVFVPELGMTVVNTPILSYYEEAMNDGRPS